MMERFILAQQKDQEEHRLACLILEVAGNKSLPVAVVMDRVFDLEQHVAKSQITADLICRQWPS